MTTIDPLHLLKKIRSLFHQACPEIEETLKWTFPHFEYRGIVGSMAAFKNHCSFGFWKASLMKDPQKILSGVGDTSMGGTKIASLDDFPSDKLMLAYIREAVDLNERDVKLPQKNERTKEGTESPGFRHGGAQKEQESFGDV